ncbi:MAG TPA: hypothetical protein VK668_10535 [Mucilaginibacter sp.]|nr:hypothetical protein [Mucilaginibacter sp.]
MKNQEIFDFIVTNPLDNLKEYNKRLVEKLDELSGRMNKVSIWMILCVAVYYLFSASMISSVSFGFMSLSKLDIVPMVIPWLFAMIILYFLTLNNHYYELLQASKIISYSIYNNPNLDVLDYTMNYNNDYVRLFNPFSPWAEIQKWRGKKQFGRFESFLILPLILILIFPFVFEFIAVERLFTKYWSYGFSKWSAAFSIWISIYSIFWVVRGYKAAIADFNAGILPQPPAPPNGPASNTGGAGPGNEQDV